MRSALLFAIVVASLALGACAKVGDAVERAVIPPDNKPHTLRVSKKEAPEILARAKLGCAESTECPDNVALLVAIHDRTGDGVTLGQCTSFLVGDDVVATNAHCIPVDLRDSTSECEGRLSFVFASGRHVACDSILGVSKIADDRNHPDFLEKADYAFVKLASRLETAKPFPVDRRGLPDGTRLRAFTIDPVKKGRIEGSLRVQECSTVQMTIVNPSYSNDFHEVALASGCEIITGNSGAPAVDESGAVRAIVFGMLPTNAGRKEISGFTPPSSFETLTYLTNTACLDFPNGTAVAGAKASISECSRKISTQMILERVRAQATGALDFDAKFADWKTRAPGVFGFELAKVKTSSNNSLADVASPILDCISKPETWPSLKSLAPRFKTLAKEGSLLSGSLDVPVWAGTYALDQLYRVSLVASTVDRAHVTFALDTALSSKGLTPVKLAIKTDKGTLKSKTFDVNLPTCGH